LGNEILSSPELEENYYCLLVEQKILMKYLKVFLALVNGTLACLKCMDIVVVWKTTAGWRIAPA